jgi:membrane-bound lytic murein transglycosylase D
MIRSRGLVLLIAILTLDGCATTPALPALEQASPASRSGAVTLERHAPPIQPVVAISTPPRSDLWQTIKDGLTLEPAPHGEPRIAAALNWAANRPHLIRALEPRAALYYGYVVAAVQERGLPLEVALLPIVESTLNPYAVSPKGATGIWQLMPATAHRYGIAMDWWYDGRRDPVDSTRAALDYLEYLHDYFDGDWLLALAAYNCGEGCVTRARRKAASSSYWALKLPRETGKYVPRILALAEVLRDPSRYGWELPPIDMEPAFALAAIDDQVDVGKIAQLAALPQDEIFRLNPGLNRQATPPNGPHRILVPAATAPSLVEVLQNYPRGPERWVQHKVKGGDTLSQIAARYHTTSAAIRSNNALKGNTIRVGQSLLVPVSATGTLPSNPMLARAGYGHRATTSYRVQRGDSLWTISRRFNTTVTRLATANGLNRQAYLRPGQTLRVPATATPQQRPRQYRVKSGDSLWAIANRFQISVADLARWNDIQPAEILKPGAHLKLEI